MTFAGVDYGAKLAGSTALTMMSDNTLLTLQSDKRIDADSWLKKMIKEYRIDIVFIDAPLSIPGAYYDNGSDFHYRSADKDLKAMSPMFLGGLTARAIQLKTELKRIEVACYEVYPGGFVRNNEGISAFYNKKSVVTISHLVTYLETILPYKMGQPIQNYHQIDSILSWYIGWRFINGMAISYGDVNEGTILI